MMKIAVMVNRFPVLSETFILNQIVGLLERGHEVYIYPSARCKPDDLAQIQLVLEKHHLLNRIFYPPNVPKNYVWRLLKGLWLLLINLRRGSLTCLSWLNPSKYGRSAYSLRLFYQRISLLGGPYDLVHCQFGTLGARILEYRRNFGLPEGKLVTSFRGYDISKYIQEHGEGIYEQLFLEGDLFLANCEFFRQRAINLGCNEQKIIVHGSGIDCHKFAFSPRYFPSDGQVCLVTTGRLVEKKGIEYSIRAVAKLVQTNPKIKIEYNIIGSGPLMASFQQLLRELGLNHIVKLLGAKLQQEVIEILDRSHIFIAPSITAATGDCDAPVNTLKEAMAMGLPVVSTDHGGIPELVTDVISGFLVPERNPDAITEKLIELIEHPERWVEMGRAGRARVEEKYEMQKLNDELVTIYQQVLNAKLPRSQLPEQKTALLHT